MHNTPLSVLRIITVIYKQLSISISGILNFGRQSSERWFRMGIPTDRKAREDHPPLGTKFAKIWPQRLYGFSAVLNHYSARVERLLNCGLLRPNSIASSMFSVATKVHSQLDCQCLTVTQCESVLDIPSISQSSDFQVCYCPHVDSVFIQDRYSQSQ